MKQILHVLTDRNIGGAGRWLLYYLTHFDRSAYRVQVLLPPDSQLISQVQRLQVPVLTLPAMAESSWDSGSLGDMTALFRREKPDIVHTHASLTARVAARRAGVPVIVATKHCMESGGGLKRLLRRWVGRRYTTKIIAVSRAVEQSLAAGGTDPGQLLTIYNGVDPQPPLTMQRQQQLRQQYGLDPAYLWVGVAARLEPVKGVDVFLQAARQILSQRQDIRFLVCGSGSQEQQLRQLAAGQEGIRMAGFVPGVEELLSLMDLTVVPSRQEALCLSALESMAQGVPAVGSRTGGVPEVVRDGETGLLFPPEDSAALARCILQLADDPARRRQLGENARQMVRREFLAEEMTRRVERLYQQLTEERKVDYGS